MSPSPEPEEKVPSDRTGGDDSPTKSSADDNVSNTEPHQEEASGGPPAGALVRTDASRSVTTIQDEEPPGWEASGGGPKQPPSGPGAAEGGEPPELGSMSFLDHLEELRRRIIRSILGVVVGFVLCWTFADEIYNALALPLTQTLRDLNLNDQLVYTSPTSPFTLYVQLSLMAGVFVAAPYIILQVWKFISPGLYPHEKRYAVPFVFLCSSLFLAGGAFAYAIAFPAALRFLLTFAHQFQPMITVNEYFSLAITIILGLALVFELPVLILFLTLLRLVTPRFLWRNTRYAVLLIFIAAAVISPTADVPNMMLFAAPMIALYFFGIGLSYLVVRMRERAS